MARVTFDRSQRARSKAGRAPLVCFAYDGRGAGGPYGAFSYHGALDKAFAQRLLKFAWRLMKRNKGKV